MDATVRTNFYQSGRETDRLQVAAAPDPGPARAAARVRDLRLLPAGRRASTSGSAPWPAADCAGRIVPRTSAPRSWAWSRHRWSRTPSSSRSAPRAASSPSGCPTRRADREAWLAEGVACYRLFISSLLDVTDNIVDGRVVPPTDVIRYDGDDPYLVVAADKGTATFSDIANEISVGAGFWLGDAFASGGSAGYDHKAMGITARGAWQSVIRHFREMGIDPQTDDFTCVGIGDMSGDVFGNGMLLSEHIKLVAAFDHRHVFIDPDPDPARSWEERQAAVRPAPVELGQLRRESDLRGRRDLPPDAEVHPDHARRCARRWGSPSSVESLSPAELITACLSAPVDLLWNGGIGTYVKATAESNAAGGRQGQRRRCGSTATSCGPSASGRAATSASPSSAGSSTPTAAAGSTPTSSTTPPGVDTSDYEVNIKILLSGEVAAGRLSGDGARRAARLDDRRGRRVGARPQLRPEPGPGQRRVPGRLDGRRPRGLDGAAVGPQAARPGDRVPAQHRGDGGAPQRAPWAHRSGAGRADGLHQDRVWRPRCWPRSCPTTRTWPIA